jgi:hypothetical protein
MAAEAGAFPSHESNEERAYIDPLSPPEGGQLPLKKGEH